MKLLYLGNSGLQLHIVNSQGRCVEQGHHHDQHIRSAGWTVGGKIEKHTNTVFVIGCHRKHLTWQQMEKANQNSGKAAFTVLFHYFGNKPRTFSVLTGSDGFQRDVHIAQWDVYSSSRAAVKRRMTGGEEVKQWTARGWAEIPGLGVGQCRRAGHWMLEERGWGGTALPGRKSRHCCRNPKAAPSSCHLTGQTGNIAHDGSPIATESWSRCRWRFPADVRVPAVIWKAHQILQILWSSSSGGWVSCGPWTSCTAKDICTRSWSLPPYTHTRK